jgi:hypothetical protein
MDFIKCFVTLAPKRYYLGISQGGFFIFLHLSGIASLLSFSFYNYFPFLAVIINPASL